LGSERERLGRVAKSLFGAEPTDRQKPTQAQPIQPTSDAQVWMEAIRIAQEEPRITFVNNKVKAVLVYLRKTVPDISISKMAAEMVEDAVKQKYPELWQRLSQG